MKARQRNTTGSDELFRQLVERVPIPLCLVNSTGKIELINDLLGYSRVTTHGNSFKK